MGSYILTVVLAVVFYQQFGTNEGCGFNEYLEIDQSISMMSPNYPDPIPVGIICRWKLSSPEKSIINLNCPDFDIPGVQPECTIDEFWFYTYDIDNKLICGKRNVDLNTTSNRLGVGLKSDKDVNPGLISYHSTRRFNCTITALENNFSTIGCGKNHLHNRIVGGDEAQVHEWPWMVALRYWRSEKQFCGGSLISPNWVLTAAHCVRKKHKDYMFVSIGEHNLKTGYDTSLTLHAHVSKIIPHQKYIHTRLTHDIAVLKLKTPVEYSHGVSPVCLPVHLQSKSFENEKVTSTGWGRIHKWLSGSADLLEVDLQVISNEECAKLVLMSEQNGYITDAFITDDKVCATGEGKSSCHGDSGGPLVWLDANGHYQLIGIVSTGTNDSACASTDSATIYTRVTDYIDWIEQETNIKL